MPSESERVTHFAPQLVELLDGVLRHIARPGDQASLALEILAARLEHLLAEVDAAISGGFGPDQRPAPGQTFACQHARKLVPDALVLAEHVSDFASAHAYVARRHIRVRADVPEKLRHEALAEAHDLGIRLPLGIEVGSALAASHGERGQRVLEDLLEGQELQDAEVDGRVESDPALVRTDRTRKLNAESAVDLNPPLVILPGDAEHDDAFRFDQTLQYPRFDVLRMPVQHRNDRPENFTDGLQELRFAGVPLLDGLEDLIYVCCCVHVHSSISGYCSCRAVAKNLRLSVV